MDKYKVSVVVPTFNTGDFLVETFESFKCQTIGFENIEVIFVDDASDDKYTVNLLKELDSCYSNVSSVFLDVNSGFPGTGRNLVFLVLGVMLVWIWLRVSVLFLQIMMIPMKKMPLKLCIMK